MSPSDAAARKADLMLAIFNPDIEISHERLVDLATLEGGYINDEVRRYACTYQA